MAANFQTADKDWLKINTYKPHEQAMLEEAFEKQTDFDIEVVKKEKEQAKFYRKYCFYRLAIFIPEYVLALVFFESKYRKAKWNIAKLCFKFLKGKLTVKEMQKEMSTLVTNNV